jgi:hypothetical protein
MPASRGTSEPHPGGDELSGEASSPVKRITIRPDYHPIIRALWWMLSQAFEDVGVTKVFSGPHDCEHSATLVAQAMAEQLVEKLIAGVAEELAKYHQAGGEPYFHAVLPMERSILPEGKL